MQVEHEQLETKIKEEENQLVVKREEYLKFNKEGFQMDFQILQSHWLRAPLSKNLFENQDKRKEQFALAQGTLEALKEELHERTEHYAQLKIKVLQLSIILLFEF